MPPNTSMYAMADKLAGGKLGEVLAAYRNEGMSFRRIAARLYADFGIEATDATVEKWADHQPEQVA